MFRFVLYVFLFVIFVSFARGIFGIVGRAFSEAARASAGGNTATTPPTVSAAGELKKDPVCGTYISTATSHRQVTADETFYFCSPECRSKFTARS